MASWVLLFGLTILFMTPTCGGIWDRQTVGFFYNMSLECSHIYSEIELYFTIVFPAISVFFYVSIVAMLKKVRPFGVT